MYTKKWVYHVTLSTCKLDKKSTRLVFTATMSSGKRSKDSHSDDVSFVDPQSPAIAQDHISPAKSRFSLKAAKDDLLHNRRVYVMAASAAFGLWPFPPSGGENEILIRNLTVRWYVLRLGSHCCKCCALSYP